MWHDSDQRLTKAVERFEDGDLGTAETMLKTLDRRGVISPRIDLYLGHCHLEKDRIRAAIRRYRRCVALIQEGTPQQSAPWVGLGLCYGRLGHLERATRAFERAHRLDPDGEEAHLNLVHCYALQGDLRRAERHARRVVELDPTSPHVFRHLAVAYMLAGHHAQALSAWDQVRLRLSDHPELPVGVARTYALLNRNADARRSYGEALDGPFAADAHFGLGELDRVDGKLDKAERCFVRALKLDPDHHEARTSRAEVLIELGRLDEAGRTLAPLLDGGKTGAGEAIEPDVVGLAAQVHFGRGERRAGFALLRRLVQQAPRLGRFDPADPLLPADPVVGAAWRVLGERLLDLGRARPAIRSLRRAWRVDADDPRVPRLLARAHGRAGDRDKAVGVLSVAVYARPMDEDLQLDLAAAQLARQRPGPAERGLVRGLSWNPESPTLWTAAAELALERGDMALSRARLRSALRRDRRHAPALGLLLRWLLARGEAQRAVHAGRAAARVLPEDDPAWRDYGRALIRLGRYREAIVPLRRYVLAVPDDPEGFLVLAEALEATGALDAAETQRRLARVVAGADSDATLTLG